MFFYYVFVKDNRIFLLLLLSLFGLISTVSADSGNSEFWARKGYKTSFTGKYVIQGGVNSSSFDIAHAFLSGRSYTLMTASSGSERQVLFVNSNIVLFAKNKQGLADSGLDILRRFPFILPETKQKNLGKFYSVKKTGTDRVANRVCDETLIQPDNTVLKRYTQKLCIDQKTGITLKQVIFLEEGRPLETLFFSEIAYKKIPLSVFKNKPALKQKVSHNTQRKGSGRTKGTDNPLPVLKGLPQMFSVIAYKETEKVKHFVLSDGFVSISVFIEPATAQDEPVSKAYYINGALAFAINQTKTQRISAVGFMPPSGLQELVSVIQ